MAQDMSAQIGLSCGTEKFYGAAKHMTSQETTQKENYAQAAQAAQSSNESQQATMWTKDDQGNLRVKADDIRDSVALSPTTVSLTDASARSTVVSPLSRAKESLDQFFQRTIAKLTGLFEDACAGDYNANKLVASVARFSRDGLRSALIRMGVSHEQLDDIQRSVRQRLCIDNKENMKNLCYDETLAKVVA